jgi:hypothetical protein
MTILNIIILLDYPFSAREYSCFGIDTLKKHFNVVVYDCTPWLNPHVWREFAKIVHICPEYKAIDSWKQFAQLIAHVPAGIVIDYLGSQAHQRQIRKILRDAGHLRAIIHLGLIPVVHLSLVQKIRVLYSSPEFFFIFASSLKKKILSSFQKTIPPDIAILSGEAGLPDHRAQAVHKIWAHSFDYDPYLRFRDHADAGVEPYAVFLDQDMAYHSDFLHSGIRSPVTADKYYSALHNFFGFLKDHTGLDLMFAAHPRSNYDKLPHLLNGLQPVTGRTPELIRDAKLVLCHDTTAISFAILWHKPLIFLTSDELERSWFGYDISYFSKVLHAPLVNIDWMTRLNPDLKTWMTIDEEAYDAYKKRYIKMPETPEKPIWEIFTDYIQHNLDRLKRSVPMDRHHPT